MDVTPAGIMAAWSAGLAGGLAFVAGRQIVGPGYVWLAAGVAGGVAALGGLAASSGLIWAGTALCLAAVFFARQTRIVVGLATAAASLLAAGAGLEGLGALGAITAAWFLGAVTTEMMLGHWYLVDPTLSRPTLRSLAVVGVVGALADAVTVSLLGAVPWDPADAVLGYGFIGLAVTSAVLMALVRAALGSPGYAGVMAATGLSYLAVITSMGAVVLGRMLI